jgi:uncharacterized protein YebE (UPF0316 family)
MEDLVLIFLVQAVYVVLMTIRVLCMVKGMKLLTTIIGFFELLVYIFGLSIVLSGDQSIAGKIVYSLGYSIGLFLGMIIENKLAIGYCVLSVNIRNRNVELINYLREDGFGVTVFVGEGREGERFMLEILTERRKLKELMKSISRYEPEAFMVSYDPSHFKGGYLKKIIKIKS